MGFCCFPCWLRRKLWWTKRIILMMVWIPIAWPLAFIAYIGEQADHLHRDVKSVFQWMDR